MVALPITCERCGKQRWGYTGCRETPECAEINRREVAFMQLGRLAREIDPTLPNDLSGYEIRITMNKDYQAVECVQR